jgi:response regulator RpfG family c-di-GMP phosphodiesterase
VKIIKKDSGTHFDPEIVEAFLNIADEFVSAVKHNYMLSKG